MENVVVALAQDLCKRVSPRVPDFFPVILAGCAHVVLMASFVVVQPSFTNNRAKKG
jgi:hypothetical protein